jgi:hypothetical protein
MDEPGFRSSGLLPVFPLPNVVFFPRTLLPLHVFEPRYRQMVRDAVDGEGLIAVALLRPGWEADYEGSPAFHAVGTVGRIEQLERLDDGRFNLRLAGLCRVELGRVVRAQPYRVVESRALVEEPVDETVPAVAAAKLSLLASQGYLLQELLAEDGNGVVLDDSVPFESAVNGACANLPVDAELRQRLLEENQILERQRRAAALLDEVLEKVLRLKSLRLGESSGIERN